MIKLLFSSLFLLMLIGCGAVPKTSLSDQEAVLSGKQVCCDDLKSINYEILETKKPKVVVLDQEVPARRFPMGISYFKALSFDASSGSHGVWIKSYFNGPLIGQYLQPLVLFLDGEHNQIAITSPRMQFIEGNLFGDQNARMEGGVRVPANARFLIVFTAKGLSGTDSAQLAPSVGAFMIGNTPVVTTNPGKAIALERSLTGELSLQLEKIPE